MFRHSTRQLTLGLVGIGIVGALAGCAAPAATTDSPDTGSGASASPSTSADGGDTGSTGSGTYKDGDYSEDGSYTAPSGRETITVNLTIKDDVVTALTVKGHATGGTQKSYQDMFVSGIKGQTVGKKLDELDGISHVSGSSLTSGGFRSAVDKIKSDAA